MWSSKKGLNLTCLKSTPNNAEDIITPRPQGTIVRVVEHFAYDPKFQVHPVIFTCWNTARV